MMRGTKDDEKLMSPMFPRLHVNDTEKGGPRAPPRNKMALYEQLSIPSQRFGTGLASTLPLPQNHGSSLVPSMSSTHSAGSERNIFAPFSSSPAPTRLDEKHLPYSSCGKLSSSLVGQEPKPTNNQNFNTSLPLSSSSKCNSLQSNNFSNFKNFSGKKIEEENDFRVPRSAQSGATLSRSISQHKDQENQSRLSLSFSPQFQNASENQKKGAGSVDLKAIKSIRTLNEENVKADQTGQGSTEKSASVPSVKDKTSVEASSSLSGKGKGIQLLKKAQASSNQEHKCSSADFQKAFCTNATMDQGFGALRDKGVHRENPLLESDRGKYKENSFMVGGEPHSRSSLGDTKKSPNALQNRHKCLEDEKCESLLVGDVEKHDGSETSMVDSVCALDITPDDVVGLIGEKQFWKARRAIVNQQRVFAVQVFELHRLIKVQKLIAGSPYLLLDGNLYVGQASLKDSMVNKQPSEFAMEQPPLTVKPKDHSHKSCPITEFADENAVAKLPLPSVNMETSKMAPLPSSFASHPASAPPAPMTTNNKPSPWCFPPPGNQWLVPVMSPSEGLVYKPYAGPCPPTAGFMAPVYGSCAPMNLTPGGGDLLNAAYGVPASHQGIGILPPTPSFGPSFFPPYVMPIMNPSISGSAVEQMRPFAGNHSKDNEFSVGDVNFPISNQSSCNMSSKVSRPISHCIAKFQVTKESEVQGSIASSLSERSKGDALPLFPTEPTVQLSDQNAHTTEHRTRIIKVVPHNPRSATESAARIFRSIQEERKQFD